MVYDLGGKAMNLDLYNPFIEDNEEIGQPKVYSRIFERVFEVASIRFETKVVEVYDEKYNAYRYFDFSEVTFMENTGFKDKNGTNIYVGNIVKKEVKDNIYLEIVEKDKDYNAFALTDKNNSILFIVDDEKIVEVVGNIYENKDLLED